MSNINDSNETRPTIKLGKDEVALDYPMASIHFLAEKYGDITKIFKKDEDGTSAKYIEKIADVVYAGLMQPDDDGKDTSGWTTQKVMNKLHFNQFGDVIAAFKRGMEVAMPESKEGEVGPTEKKQK